MLIKIVTYLFLCIFLSIKEYRLKHKCYYSQINVCIWLFDDVVFVFDTFLRREVFDIGI